MTLGPFDSLGTPGSPGQARGMPSQWQPVPEVGGIVRWIYADLTAHWAWGGGSTLSGVVACDVGSSLKCRSDTTGWLLLMRCLLMQGRLSDLGRGVFAFTDNLKMFQHNLCPGFLDCPVYLGLHLIERR